MIAAKHTVLETAMTRQVAPYMAVLSTVAATTWYHTGGLLLQSGNIACKNFVRVTSMVLSQCFEVAVADLERGVPVSD